MESRGNKNQRTRGTAQLLAHLAPEVKRTLQDPHDPPGVRGASWPSGVVVGSRFRYVTHPFSTPPSWHPSLPRTETPINGFKAVKPATARPGSVLRGRPAAPSGPGLQRNSTARASALTPPAGWVTLRDQNPGPPRAVVPAGIQPLAGRASDIALGRGSRRGGPAPPRHA